LMVNHLGSLVILLLRLAQQSTADADYELDSLSKLPKTL
jgi:hypothetical protein